MKKILVVLVLSLCLSACGSGAPEPTLEPIPAPTPTPVPSPVEMIKKNTTVLSINPDGSYSLANGFVVELLSPLDLQVGETIMVVEFVCDGVQVPTQKISVVQRLNMDLTLTRVLSISPVVPVVGDVL